MENDAGWHGKAPNEEQYAVAREELRNRVRICTDVAAVDSMDDAVEVLEKLGLMDEEGEN